MKIIIGFSTSNLFVSRVIRWLTDADVSHSYIRIYDKHLHAPLIIHADWPGVIFEHAEMFDGQNQIIEEYEIEDERLHNGLRKNLKHLRKPYNWPALLYWILVIKFPRWFKKKIKHPTETPKSFICVDFIVRILNDSGITHLPIGDMHPRSFRRWIKEHYEDFGWRKI